MFEWLDEEISLIKTPKFHLVDGPASVEFRLEVESCDFTLPASYREFVLRYGNANLYRAGSYWLVRVFGRPREAESQKSEPLIQIGCTHTSEVFFKESLLNAYEDSPVFEWRHHFGLRRAADSFENWLKTKCKSARKRFKKKEWEAIEQGPAPFTKREQAIVEARKKFEWRVVGIAPNEDIQFEIQNRSSMLLSFLSVGIRGKLRPPASGPLNGGVFLPVALIRPGETKVVDFDCYKKYISPEETEAFTLPDPGPEDRDQYWEFKS